MRQLALFSVYSVLTLGASAQQVSLLQQAEQEVSRVVERALPAVVTIEARLSGRPVRSSGFVIDSSGLIVCSADGVRAQPQVSVYLTGGGAFSANVIGVDNITGIALLRVRPEVRAELTALRWGDSERTPLGATAILIGNRGGLQGSVTVGTLGGKDRVGVRADNQRTVLVLQFNGTVGSGEPGAPLLDSQGRVIGVMIAQLAYVDGMQVPPTAITGFAVPSEIAQRVVNELRTKGRAEHAWLGVAYGVAPQGVFVQSVMPNSPAQQAGLQVGDLIEQFGDKPIRTVADITRELYRAQPNQRVNITIRREGQRLTLPVTLGKQSL
ncbi:MAG: S1C family serine protease [Fimbriimonadales bacterium]|nr:S1C family serine protease [Fimbriimonadales bacterium]